MYVIVISIFKEHQVLSEKVYKGSKMPYVNDVIRDLKITNILNFRAFYYRAVEERMNDQMHSAVDEPASFNAIPNHGTLIARAYKEASLGDTTNA